MISPDMFPSTEMEISEKLDRSSANYISENWKRNNEHLTMLSKNCKTGISLLKSYQIVQVLRHWYYCRLGVHKKEKFIQFLSSKRQKRGFSADINVQLKGHIQRMF